MRYRLGAAGVFALVLTLGVSALAQAAGYQQRHEISVDPGPAGAAAVVTIGNGPDGPQDVRTGHELRLHGVPQPPRAAAPQPPALPVPGLTLPNLAPLPPYDVFVGPAEQPSGPVWSNLGSLGDGGYVPSAALRFTTTIQNRGAHSFELVGTPWQPDPAHEDLLTTQAYQCLRFFGHGINGAVRKCGEYRHVGSLTWHAQHRHFHINGFGRYELRRDAGGKPDMSPQGVVGRAQKLGWCVSDMYNWREDATPGQAGEVNDAVQEPYERAWYQECTNPVLYTGASWRQGISPGWADTYPALYTGQEIPLKGVADGRYWIVTTINPKDNEYGLQIAETTWADNASASLVEIYAGGKKAKLIAPMPAKPYADWYDNPEDQPGN